MSSLTESFAVLARQSAAEQKKAIAEAVDALPKKEINAIADALSGKLLPPDPRTNGLVWLIVVWAFAIAMLAAVVVLGLGYFISPAASGTKPDTILTIFTTVTAFLAGLFAPSPINRTST